VKFFQTQCADDNLMSVVLGLKMQFQLLNTESFRRIGAELSPHGLPGNYKKALYSTEYLERFVRSQTMSGHHPVGTCKMGSTRDLSAVVDPELKYVLSYRLIHISVQNISLYTC